MAQARGELTAELRALGNSFDAQREQLDSIDIRPVSSVITVHFVGVGCGDEL